MSTSLAKTNLKKPVIAAIVGLEFVLAVLVIVGTAWYLFSSIDMLVTNMSDSQQFFSTLIQIFLTAVIGIEVARVLITHNLYAMFDVIGLILVRKALNPDVSAVDVLVVVTAFVLLVVTYAVVRRVQVNDSENIDSALKVPTSFFSGLRSE